MTVFAENDTQHVLARSVHFPNEHMQRFPESRMRSPGLTSFENLGRGIKKAVAYFTGSA